MFYAINYIHGDPSRLGHHQGLREQHPDGVQQDSTFSSTITYYVSCLVFQNKPIQISFMDAQVDRVTLRDFSLLINPRILHMF